MKKRIVTGVGIAVIVGTGIYWSLPEQAPIVEEAVSQEVNNNIDTALNMSVVKLKSKQLSKTPENDEVHKMRRAAISAARKELDVKMLREGAEQKYMDEQLAKIRAIHAKDVGHNQRIKEHLNFDVKAEFGVDVDKRMRDLAAQNYGKEKSMLDKAMAERGMPAEHRQKVLEVREQIIAAREPVQ